MASYSVDELSQHPQAIIGPRFVTAVIQGLESGLIVNLAYRFWKDDFAETTVMKAIVSFVITVSFMQTALTFRVVYKDLILNFADWAQLLNSKAGDADLVLIVLLAMPPKAIFIWRCWKLVRHRSRHVIIAILSVLWIGSVAASILLIYKVFTGDNARHTPNDPYFISHLFVAIALDAGICCTLTYNTLPMRPEIFTKSITTTIYRVSFVVWESTFPPCACLFVSLVLYLTTIRTSLWANLFYSITGQLYVISLFTVLMGMQTATSGHARHGCAASWSTDPAAVTTRGREVDNASIPNFELRDLPASSRSSTVSEDVRAEHGAPCTKSACPDAVPEAGPARDCKSPSFNT